MIHLDPNKVTGVVALLMSSLVAYAYWGHVRQLASEPIGRMAAGVFAFVSIMAARLMWWDVVWNLLPAETLQYIRAADWLGSSPGTWINAGLNSLWICACYVVLSSIHMSIPKAERKNWNVLTAPFYPHRVRIFRRYRK